MTRRPELTTVINNLTDYDVYLDTLAKADCPQGLPFVEFLWDNYAHLEPARVLDALGPLGKRVAFHVMWSRFLDLEQDAFGGYLTLVTSHVREMRPVYVSEHCCTFQVGSVNLLAATEVDWEPRLGEICDRVSRYQDAIGQRLLLENYGSTHEGGKRQVEHLAEIASRTGCGILFDVSNAVMSDLNGVAPFDEWLELLRDARGLRCHVGGYSRDPRLLVFEDSHAVDLSEATRRALMRTLRELDVASVCYERAFNLSSETMSREMRMVQSTIEEVCGEEEPGARSCG